MSTAKWFGRKFDFNFGNGKYPAIYERLQQAPDILASIILHIPEDILLYQPDGKWSVKEHVGHLSILEPLWRTRIQDITQKKAVLTATDLDNKKTSEAGFNDYTIAALLRKFREERKITLSLLDSMNVPEHSHTSLHPRLEQPMRIIDILYFTAEHDDHHTAAIRELIG
ncbi:hypothetical protein A3860_06425 [Niastella vici]|uniref:DinB-like domain-containing protein n=1 Tax=Niastella vici TaxID=1703345 RepID=A0A1V9FSM3_9BACT|nr:DinB family protein [Niastella vici]OQP61342.1 hypothetical protein A3860_06425 [Niastella vici]